MEEQSIVWIALAGVLRNRRTQRVMVGSCLNTSFIRTVNLALVTVNCNCWPPVDISLTFHLANTNVPLAFLATGQCDRWIIPVFTTGYGEEKGGGVPSITHSFRCVLRFPLGAATSVILIILQLLSRSCVLVTWYPTPTLPAAPVISGRQKIRQIKNKCLTSVNYMSH